MTVRCVRRLCAGAWGWIVGPLVRSRTIPSALCSDPNILGIPCECSSNQFFAEVRIIRVCGIYEVDAELNSTAKNRAAAGSFGGPQMPSPEI
jgi:hypothetical protein